jgi:DNA-binding response OmpR family regulator
MAGGQVARRHCSGIASLVAAATVLVIAPDREFRRSLEFALEVEGFSVSSHALLSEAEASLAASGAVCAVVDEGALRIDRSARRSLGRLIKPVILLSDGFSSIGDDSGLAVLTKPLQGSALIELVQAIQRAR